MVPEHLLPGIGDLTVRDGSGWQLAKSQLRSNMPLQRIQVSDRSDRTCEKNLQPTSPSSAEGKQPSCTLHRRAKTKSSVWLSSSGPGKPSAATSLHHTGWKQWPWSIHTRFYLGLAAGGRPELNRATHRLRTTTRTHLPFSAQAFSPPIPSHSDGTLTYLLSPPDHELPSKHNVYPHPKHNT